ncbi:hypothetical protein EDB84DRAFT_1442601 [Lactarius hengduanensis]|nr:hypothetical protein EDB84DRAFT_1442601 [Lactarius hengduanensis]
MSGHTDQSSTGTVCGGALEAFEHLQRSLVTLGSTWAECPLWSQMVTKWLSRFYRAWDHLESMARNRREARLYAKLDWLVMFPRIATPNQDRLIQFYGVLDQLYFSAFVLRPSLTGDDPPVFDFAIANFKYFCNKAVISSEDFKWCEAKLAHIKAKSIFEHNLLSQIPGPSSVTQKSRQGSEKNIDGIVQLSACAPAGKQDKLDKLAS